MTISKSANPSTINELENTTITIKVENTGTADAKNIEVTDSIPVEFTLVSGSINHSYGTLKPNEWRTYQYTIKPTKAGRFVTDVASATYEDEEGNTYSSTSNVRRSTEKHENIAGEAKNGLFLSPNFLNLAEIRAESSFRPAQDDIEVLYALSGRRHNIPDTFHKLSSRYVTKEATQSLIIANTEELVKHILKEAEEEPELIVIVHTHPAGIAHPSEIDREFCTPATKTIREYVPDAHIIFGIHSLSREEIRERAEPKKRSKI